MASSRRAPIGCARWPRPRWARSANGWASARRFRTPPKGPPGGGRPPHGAHESARLPWADRRPIRRRHGTEATRDVDPGPSRVQFELSPRQRQLLDAFLVLATIALAFVVLGF